MNKEEYTIEKIQIPRMIDLDVVASVNNCLSVLLPDGSPIKPVAPPITKIG